MSPFHVIAAWGGDSKPEKQFFTETNYWECFAAPNPACYIVLTQRTCAIRFRSMPDDDDFDDQKRLRAAENLGWLAGGSYTKKRKLIEGSVFCHKPGQVAMLVQTRLVHVIYRSLGG